MLQGRGYLALEWGTTLNVTALDSTSARSQPFPTEQARIIQLLVRRVTVITAGLEVDIRREGIADVIREMVAQRRMEAAEWKSWTIRSAC